MGAIGDNAAVTMVVPRRVLGWPVVVGSVPPLASAFRVRDSVLERMAGQAGVVLSQVMAGDGGVGKSQIAAGVFGSSGADLRVWVAAESRTAVLTGYAQAAVRLDLADADGEPERLAGLFLGYLKAAERDWLVVLDDVGDPGIWPGCGRPGRGGGCW